MSYIKTFGHAVIWYLEVTLFLSWLSKFADIYLSYICKWDIWMRNMHVACISIDIFFISIHHTLFFLSVSSTTWHKRQKTPSVAPESLSEKWHFSRKEIHRESALGLLKLHVILSTFGSPSLSFSSYCTCEQVRTLHELLYWFEFCIYYLLPSGPTVVM